MTRLKQLLDNKGASAVTIEQSASLADAIRIMHQHRVGSVIIPSSSGEPLGILTERDVIRLFAEGHTDFEKLRVQDCMTTGLMLGNPDDDTEQVLVLMTEKRFRHLPIVYEGHIVGVISIGDLVKAKLQETSAEAKALRDYIHS
ncbi:MAG: CBS domain-containing protein [Gammaproteobacteria bacterium]|nr:CBS domain-containing protein [Gammaproteobacteria bacterium]MCP5458925.1 CBS domain-containing protein [Gammaproteobacteria bacterium]